MAKSSARELARILRERTLKLLIARYPEGFSVKMMLEEYPEIFANKKQAADFLLHKRRTEGNLKLIRKDGECLYVEEQDIYALLNKLWRKTA